MIRHSFTAALLLFAAPSFADPGRAATEGRQDYSPGKIDWVRDPKVGFQRAQLEGRAALLYFTASW